MPIFLEPFSTKHITSEYCSYVLDPEVNKYSYRKFYNTSTKTIAEDAIKELNNSLLHKFAIILCGVKVHIGNISLVEYDAPIGCAELGILIFPPYWARGYGEKATRELLNFAFFEMKLNRVELGTYNPAALRMFHKAGFLLEGVRENKFPDGSLLLPEYLIGINRKHYQRGS